MNINNSFIQKYQPYLYNLALRLVYYPNDAKDLTQDVWVKIINSIDTFEQNSDFKTWAYRILINEFLNQQRQKRFTILEFDEFATTMTNMKDEHLNSDYDEQQKELLLNEAKVGCMLGMLLCLKDEERAIFVLGEIFEIKSEIGALIFDISNESFRKKLSRAREKIYDFMDKNCSLINKVNICKCKNKVNAMLELKYIDEANILFNSSKISLKKALQLKSDKLDEEMENLYKELYQEHPFCEFNEIEFAKNILKNSNINKIFNF